MAGLGRNFGDVGAVTEGTIGAAGGARNANSIGGVRYFLFAKTSSSAGPAMKASRRAVILRGRALGI